MSLKDYELTDEKRPASRSANPLATAKKKMVAAINTQRARIAGSDGRRWDFVNAFGKVHVKLYYGTTPIVTKSYMVGEAEKLPKFYDDVEEAVKAGDFDEALGTAIKNYANRGGLKAA